MEKRVKTFRAFLDRLKWPRLGDPFDVPVSRRVPNLSSASLGLLSLGLFSLSPAPLAASEARGSGDGDRWVPSFSILSGINSQNGSGSVETSDVKDPWTPSQSTVDNLLPEYTRILPGSPLSAQARMMTPYAGLSLEIMTPSVLKILRGFAHVDVSYTFGPEYNLPSSGNPGPFVAGDTTAAPDTLVQGTILGQGSRTTPLVQPLQVTAGAGVAFTMRAWDRTLRIKPSVEYLREEIQVKGLVRRAVRLDPTPTSPTPDDSFFRTVNLAGENSHVYHGLGPGLEVELETGRAGPFKVALYVSAKGWKFLNNDPQSFEVRNEDPLYCPPPPPGQVNCSSESATFGFTKDDWAYGANLGIRFRWVPE
jgi:hypothetical protein